MELKKPQITIKYFKRVRQLNFESFWITIKKILGKIFAEFLVLDISLF